ncbi:hypothetical protein HN903_00870 [archaeon]|mgnify:FL=1|jgi:hypothetical protein|nr:hypothetical protein [archaeon]MBT6955841.1 hypothetical protein [archaeon]MBT7128283.1 hypothetical protein [archaeon]
MKKSGQFFLLAAVIISAVVISLGVTTNRAMVNEEPDSFYDFSYEVQREIGAVLDYGVYTDFEDDVNLSVFVDLLSDEIFEEDVDTEFIIIHINDSDDMSVQNHFSVEKEVRVEGELIEAPMDALSDVCQGGSCKKVEKKDKDVKIKVVKDKKLDKVIEEDHEKEVEIEIEGVDYYFPITGHNQIIVFMTKDVNGDRHVAAN